MSHPAVQNRLLRMYRCQLCLCAVGPGVRAHRAILETRQKKYPFRPKANRVIRRSERGNAKERFVDDPGGVGEEIVRECLACPTCARNLPQ
ncbi:MAG TPA: hypothetical protein VFG04_15695 [Planctomycetaceae bacterium]|nr:hypothetical protein [Planctomycetaceae bacterium]